MLFAGSYEKDPNLTENRMARAQRVAVVTLAILSVVAIDACHKKPPAVAPAPAPAGPNQDSIDAARRRADSIAAADAAAARQRAMQDSIARANAAASAAMDAMRTTLTTAIHFDYDKSDLRDDARAALDAKLPILQANQGVQLRITGNADQRGSDEYNMALGERRAAEAKRYLVAHGVADSRLSTASNGKEKLLCTDATEDCYAQNRRDEFEISAGGDRLARPNTP